VCRCLVSISKVGGAYICQICRICTYAYSCIFPAYFFAYQVHIFCIFSAYFLHIRCIFIAYFLHIYCIFSAYLLHIFCIYLHIRCISGADLLHICCIFSAYFLNSCAYFWHIFAYSAWQTVAVHVFACLLRSAARTPPSCTGISRLRAMPEVPRWPGLRHAAGSATAAAGSRRPVGCRCRAGEQREERAGAEVEAGKDTPLEKAVAASMAEGNQ